jgi:hypothetical protein
MQWYSSQSWYPKNPFTHENPQIGKKKTEVSSFQTKNKKTMELLLNLILEPLIKKIPKIKKDRWKLLTCSQIYILQKLPPKKLKPMCPNTHKYSKERTTHAKRWQIGETAATKEWWEKLTDTNSYLPGMALARSAWCHSSLCALICWFSPCFARLLEQRGYGGYGVPRRCCVLSCITGADPETSTPISLTPIVSYKISTFSPN